MSSNNMAQKIKELRKKRNLTLEQVASVVGVGKSTVRKWETGMIANMKRDKIASLAKALDTTPAYLMGWEESPINELPQNIIDDVLVELLTSLSELTGEERAKVSAFIEGLKANR